MKALRCIGNKGYLSLADRLIIPQIRREHRERFYYKGTNRELIMD